MFILDTILKLLLGVVDIIMGIFSMIFGGGGGKK